MAGRTLGVSWRQSLLPGPLIYHNFGDAGYSPASFNVFIVFLRTAHRWVDHCSEGVSQVLAGGD